MLCELLIEPANPAPPSQNDQKHKADHGRGQNKRQQQNGLDQTVSGEPPARHLFGSEGCQKEYEDARDYRDFDRKPDRGEKISPINLHPLSPRLSSIRITWPAESRSR